MSINSQSFLNLKVQIQSSFDFVYVVCQAVPCLKLQSSLVNKGTISALPLPDYFGVSNSLEQIREKASNYKGELCKYLLLSSFSFFEAFVINIVKEFIEFHGGSEKLQTRAENRIVYAISAQVGKNPKERIHLRNKNPAHKLRRWKASRTLKSNNYMFPTQLFSSFGVKMLIEQLGNIKSVDIPKYLKRVFSLDFTE